MAPIGPAPARRHRPVHRRLALAQNPPVFEEFYGALLQIAAGPLEGMEDLWRQTPQPAVARYPRRSGPPVAGPRVTAALRLPPAQSSHANQLLDRSWSGADRCRSPSSSGALANRRMGPHLRWRGRGRANPGPYPIFGAGAGLALVWDADTWFMPGAHKPTEPAAERWCDHVARLPGGGRAGHQCRLPGIDRSAASTMANSQPVPSCQACRAIRMKARASASV